MRISDWSSDVCSSDLCESYNREYGRDYRSVMPTNLYGPNDNFHPDNSHVIPALLRRLHEAVQSDAEDVVIWGSGKPMREFLHVDDLDAESVHVKDLHADAWKGARSEGSSVGKECVSTCRSRWGRCE